MLAAKLLISINQTKELCQQIKEIESDCQLTAITKLLQLQNIRSQIKKVGTDIDNLKEMIKLLNGQTLN